MSAQVAYVLTKADNLQMNLGANNVTALLPYNASTTGPVGGGALGQEPFPDFGGGSTGRMIGASIYNGLQTKLEQQFSSGLNFLLTYTFSRTFTDAGDLLNGGSLNGARAPDVPGFGVRGDWSLASFNITNVFHFSGGYELPFGKDKHYLANTGKLGNAFVGGWSINWITTLQGGQPLSLGCPTGTTTGTRLQRCDRTRAEPEARNKGQRQNASGKLTPYWLGNPAAFQQPCQLGGDPTPNPAGCIPDDWVSVIWATVRGRLPGQATIGSTSPHSRTFRSMNASAWSSGLSSSTSSTIRISMLRDSAATALSRFRTQPTSTTLTSAPSDLPAMLPTLRGKYNLL